MENKKDEVFKKRLQVIEDFKFNDIVAEAFDDMVTRSIPFYDEIHKIVVDLSRFLYLDGKRVYDLGCSTGTTISILSKFLSEQGIFPHYVGIDSSESMLKKARVKLDSVTNLELICSKIQEIEFKESALIVMNYTLQFIPQDDRLGILKKMAESLQDNGMLLLAEKISCESDRVHNLVTDLYYDFKRRNGYSELEISQKREALENVMIPISMNEQISMLKDAGFSRAEMIFRFYNFALYLAVK